MIDVDVREWRSIDTCNMEIRDGQMRSVRDSLTDVFPHDYAEQWLI